MIISVKRLARLRANRIFTAPCDTSVLYPTSGGNIHEFTAITPCAVLDVLGPPYSKDDGRDCSYYKDSPYDATLGKPFVLPVQVSLLYLLIQYGELS